MSSAPVAYVQPNYHEMVKKRKQFGKSMREPYVMVAVLTHYHCVAAPMLSNTCSSALQVWLCPSDSVRDLSLYLHPDLSTLPLDSASVCMNSATRLYVNILCPQV